MLAADAARPKAPRSATGGDAGSGSDTDTSRPGRIRIKHSRPGSPVENRSPNGSRAGSPTGSRAQSPKRTAPAPAKVAPPQPNLPIPTLEDVKAAIPAEGIVLADLVKLFKERVAGKAKTQEFITLVKQVARQDTETKKLVPKPAEA